jgi:hypothetical protein
MRDLPMQALAMQELRRRQQRRGGRPTAIGKLKLLSASQPASAPRQPQLLTSLSSPPSTC